MKMEIRKRKMGMIQNETFWEKVFYEVENKYACLTWEAPRKFPEFCRIFSGISPILQKLKTYGWAVGQGPRSSRRQGAAPSNIFNLKAVLQIYCSIS